MKAQEPLTSVEELVQNHPQGVTPENPILNTAEEVDRLGDQLEEAVAESRKRDRKAMADSYFMARGLGSRK